MRIVFITLALASACGARSEIAGSDALDSSTPATSDAASSSDVFTPFPVDATSPDAVSAVDATTTTCVVTNVMVGFGGGTMTSCKFQVTWTCGDQMFSAGGACDPPGVGPEGGFYDGVCRDAHGNDTNMFKSPTMTCPCTDSAALGEIVLEQCEPGQHQ